MVQGMGLRILELGLQFWVSSHWGVVFRALGNLGFRNWGLGFAVASVVEHEGIVQCLVLCDMLQLSDGGWPGHDITHHMQFEAIRPPKPIP